MVLQWPKFFQGVYFCSLCISQLLARHVILSGQFNNLDCSDEDNETTVVENVGEGGLSHVGGTRAPALRGE
jgi:hypothetical protein